MTRPSHVAATRIQVGDITESTVTRRQTQVAEVAPPRLPAYRMRPPKVPRTRDAARGTAPVPVRRSARPPDIPLWVSTWWPPGGSYGRCPSGGTHLVFILDESGSVATADPVAHRHLLLGRFIDTLVPACTCGECVVSLVLFGATASTPTRSAVTSGWGSAVASVWMSSLPATGSYLAPALNQVEARSLPASGVVVCLTDSQLFDEDPAEQIERLSSCPHPLLLAVGSAQASPLSLPLAVVDAQSPPTHVIDVIARHLQDARSGQDPSGTDNSEPQDERPARRWRPSPLWSVLIIGLLLMAGATLAWETRHHPGTSTSSAAHTTGSMPAAPTADDGFTIPGLSGNAPRTTPAATTILIDASLRDSSAVLAQIRRELPAVVDYMRSYAITGDSLQLGASRPVPITSSRITGALTTLRADTNPTSADATVRGRPADAVNVVVILTDRPAAWAARLGMRSSSGRQPLTKYAVLNVAQPGVVPQALQGDGPWAIPAGARTPGGIAIPVARAWAGGIKATWRS